MKDGAKLRESGQTGEYCGGVLVGPNDRHQGPEEADEVPLPTVPCMAWLGVMVH